MNYELAKQLKEAGFPQKGKGHMEKHFAWITGKEPYFSEPKEIDLYIPTLSELVKEFGIDFGMEAHLTGWYAWQARVMEPRIETWGRTPDEAVAKLWLALHNA
jgi:hypothetical protein